MVAILRWFGRFLLVEGLTEAFKRASIFLAFNIIIAFMLNYITNNTFDVSIFSLGDSVTSLLGGLPPFVLYVLVKFQGIHALFIVLNAYLARFAYRITFKAMGAR